MAKIDFKDKADREKIEEENLDKYKYSVHTNEDGSGYIIVANEPKPLNPALKMVALEKKVEGLELRIIELEKG